MNIDNFTKKLLRNLKVKTISNLEYLLESGELSGKDSVQLLQMLVNLEDDSEPEEAPQGVTPSLSNSDEVSIAILLPDYKSSRQAGASK